MLRRSACSLFRILPIVHPPVVAQSIFVAAPCDELPDSASSSARKRERLKRTFRLRQIDQILRNSFFMEHPGNHFLIAAAAPQSCFDNRFPTRRLEEV